MRLVVTRPAAEAARTAEALRRLGHEPILSPALELVVDPEAKLPDGPFQAVTATSGNGVKALAALVERSGAAHFKELPFIAVGDRTAIEARRAGFGQARSAGGTAAQLMALITAELDPAAGPLLHVAGDVQSADMAAGLGSAGFAVETLVLYRMQPQASLSREAAMALRFGAADGVLVYSRRSAAAFAAAAGAAGLVPLASSVACFCLSATCAEPLAAIAPGPKIVAAAPDELNLLAAIEGYRSNVTPGN